MSGSAKPLSTTNFLEAEATHTTVNDTEASRTQAVVIGASMAGLLSARVLAERMARVVVVDRDDLPREPANRGRVPQGQHAHGLLASGLTVLEDLFPGLTDELVARGALIGDLLADTLWVIGGREMARPAVASGPTGLLISRPVLESVIRSRVAGLPNVEILPRSRVTGLLTVSSCAGPAVTGVLLDGGPAVLHAGLVVDASGRTSRALDWLEELGYVVPATERVRVDLSYTTREFRRGGMELDGARALVVAASQAVPRSGALLAQEGDRWILSLGGYGGDRAPEDLRGFAAFAGSLPSPWPRRVVEQCEPLGPARHFRMVQSVRHRFEDVIVSPRGFLVVGDALCAFNPVYGQGMSTAALEAVALGEEFAGDPATLATRFYHRAATLLDAPWDVAVTSDLALPAVPGVRTSRVRMVNAYLGQVSRAASVDPAVAARMLSVLNIQAPPESLFEPAALRAILTGSVRERRRARQRGAGGPTTATGGMALGAMAAGPMADELTPPTIEHDVRTDFAGTLAHP